MLMRYSSKRQEQFAHMGRIEVVKEVHSDGWTEYKVKLKDEVLESLSSKQAAVEWAKRYAVALEKAYNPLFDYREEFIND